MKHFLTAKLVLNKNGLKMMGTQYISLDIFITRYNYSLLKLISMLLASDKISGT